MYLSIYIKLAMTLKSLHLSQLHLSHLFIKLDIVIKVNVTMCL